MIKGHEHGNEIPFSYVFDFIELSSSYLKRIVGEVIEQISHHMDFDEEGFGPIIERSTIFSMAGEVTEDGIIYLDTNRLKKLPDEVVRALVAHELAHSHLKHFSDSRCSKNLDCEHEADEQARKWGFNIHEFRRVCGPASMP